MTRRCLAVRLDSAGDVLVTGPAIRALAATHGQVTVLAGPRGSAAARLLPGVGDVLTWHAPWVARDPPAVRASDVAGIVSRLRAGAFTDAVVFTSFHQSALPTALLLRMAGIGRIAAISEDYPGSLLDVRHRPGEPDIPEPLRALDLARAAGYRLRRGDDGRLAVRHPLPFTTDLTGTSRYVVLHPGADAPARRWPLSRWAEAAALLTSHGRRVVLTGGRGERALTATVVRAVPAAGRALKEAAPHVHDPFHGGAGALVDLGGRTTLPELASVLAQADAVLVANTGPAHLAAAVGTPVVSLFAPVVPAARWAPYGVPLVVLGDQQAACRGSRAVHCPLTGHPCLTGVSAAEACAALERLAAGHDAAGTHAAPGRAVPGRAVPGRAAPAGDAPAAGSP